MKSGLMSLVTAEFDGDIRAEGAIALERPLQEMYGGMYFPIPSVLKDYLVPTSNQEIRVYLYCEWIDMRTARHWSTE